MPHRLLTATRSEPPLQGGPTYARGLRIAGRRFAFIFALLVVSTILAETPPSAPKNANQTATFSSAVNWDFSRLEKLEAWRNTSTVIRKSLRQWYAQPIRGGDIENTTGESLRAFLADATKSPADGWSVFYLASHQSRAGKWHFPNDQPHSWAQILTGIQSSGKAHRFVILDSCFAEAADQTPLAKNLGAAGILFASNPFEEVHEVDFRHRFPIDLSRRFPAEAKWLRDSLGGDWNGRVSFLGFVWLQAFLATPEPPVSLEGWARFFRLCEKLALEFREGRGARVAATIRFVAPSSAGSK